jgi:hypothetical protein
MLLYLQPYKSVVPKVIYAHIVSKIYVSKKGRSYAGRRFNGKEKIKKIV